MEINSKPEELDVLDRKIMQLEIEIEAIKREKDESKLKSLRSDLANLKEERNEINAKWKSEKEVVDNIQNAKQILKTLKLKLKKQNVKEIMVKLQKLDMGKLKKHKKN